MHTRCTWHICDDPYTWVARETQSSFTAFAPFLAGWMNAFPASHHKPKEYQKCVVCKPVAAQKGRYAKLPPEFVPAYRCKEDEAWCCKSCWDKVILTQVDSGRKRRKTDMFIVNDACKASYITPPPHKASRSTSSQSHASSQSSSSQGRPKAAPVTADLCMLCHKNQHDHVFEEDTVNFSLANFALKCLGKPVSGDAIVVCRRCRESCVSIGSAIDNIAKRGNLVEDVSFQWLPRGPKSSVSRLMFDVDEIDQGQGKKTQDIDREYEEMRLKLAQLQADCNISAEASAQAYELLLGRCVSSRTAQRCLFEVSERCFQEMCRALSSSTDVALGCDGSTTFWERSGLEAHVSFDDYTELLGVCEQPKKSATDYLTSLLKFWDRVQKTQRLLGVKVTSLYYVRTLYSDNASVNCGATEGLCAQLNAKRREAHAADGIKEPFRDLFFKGCDDHIAALILKLWSTKVVRYALDSQSHGFLAWKKKTNGHIALPLHVLKTLGKRLLGFLRPSWQGSRTQHDKANPPPQGKYRPRIIPCSLNRFCTFGVSARGLLHYRDIILPLLKPDVETDQKLSCWLQSDCMIFCMELIAHYSRKFELPFLAGSHKLGNCTPQEYGQWLQATNNLLDTWLTDPTLLFDGRDLDHSEYCITKLLIDSIKDVWDKHVLSKEYDSTTTTIRTTNRWGETVFRYMREYLVRQQHTRMVVVEAYVRSKLSAFRPLVDQDPTLLSQVRARAREVEGDPNAKYAKYCEDKANELVARNVHEKEKRALQEYYDDFLQRLQDCGLVPESENRLTIQVLQNAVDAFRARYPDSHNLLRRNGTKDFLIHQFSDAIFAMV